MTAPAPPPLSECELPAQAFDAALLDLDGVCFHGTRPIPNAQAAIVRAREAGMRIGFVTNNASRTRAQVVEHLASVGIAAHEEAVMTSSDAIAVLMAAELPAGAPVLVVGADGLLAAVAGAGLRPVFSAEDRPLAVVQGYGPQVGWPILAEATYAINAGARYFATNLDLTLPTERGFAPGNGALVAAVQAATGLSPIAAGKPAPGIFHAAARQVGATNPIVVGDRLDTDIEGAHAAGLPSLFVLSGVNSALDAALAPPSQRPTFLAPDLLGLLQAQPVALADDAGARCGGAAAVWRSDRLEVTGADAIERDRAACAAVWHRLDRGESVARDSLAAWMTP